MPVSSHAMASQAVTDWTQPSGAGVVRRSEHPELAPLLERTELDEARTRQSRVAAGDGFALSAQIGPT